MAAENKHVQSKAIVASATNDPSTVEKEKSENDKQMEIASEKLRYENADAIYPE